jgi:predicted thioesterase
VLGTPRVIALGEAACSAVAGALEPGSTSVGTWIEVEHLVASPIGVEVVAVAAMVGRGRRRSPTRRALDWRCSTSATTLSGT